MKYCFLMFERAKEVCSVVGAEGVGRRRGGGQKKRGADSEFKGIFVASFYSL